MSLTIDLTPDQEQQVRAAAGRAGRSPEALVADLVSRALESEQPQAEARDKSAREPEVAELPVEMHPDYRGAFPGWDAELQPGVYSYPGAACLIVGPSCIGPDSKDIYEGMRATPEQMARILTRPPIQPGELRRLAKGRPEDIPAFQEAMAELRRETEESMLEADRRWQETFGNGDNEG